MSHPRPLRAAVPGTPRSSGFDERFRVAGSRHRPATYPAGPRHQAPSDALVYDGLRFTTLKSVYSCFRPAAR